MANSRTSPHGGEKGGGGKWDGRANAHGRGVRQLGDRSLRWRGSGTNKEEQDILDISDDCTDGGKYRQAWQMSERRGVASSLRRPCRSEHGLDSIWCWYFTATYTYTRTHARTHAHRVAADPADAAIPPSPFQPTAVKTSGVCGDCNTSIRHWGRTVPSRTPFEPNDWSNIPCDLDRIGYSHAPTTARGGTLPRYYARVPHQ
ncbi:MAG: hypothetical protein FE78DRAFT_506483 [Acidomyces sp. 'richmondensis']|nr:MAG: hypothetical protein FE78DRAFT_506483 [Acidomyces sp. 'richmondensis']